MAAGEVCSQPLLPGGTQGRLRGALHKVPAILDKILRAGREQDPAQRLKRIADQVNSIEDDFRACPDAECARSRHEFKQRHAMPSRVDDLLPEAFATGPRGCAPRARASVTSTYQILGGATTSTEATFGDERPVRARP
ncbi:hypothetical protein [Nonomuraea dietziae]|uniref:hypothetical protein n=1 Tax=Nonomuraea dietziae TaxID=65515 RepID=UPI003CD0B844